MQTVEPSEGAFTDPQHIALSAWDGIGDQEYTMPLKVVPDSFLVPNNCDKQKIVLYIYQIVVTALDQEKLAQIGSTADECVNNMNAMNAIGFATKQALPEAALKDPSELFFLDVILSMKVLYRGTIVVSENDVQELQRFHKAAICLEDSHAFHINEYFPLHTKMSEELLNSSSSKWNLHSYSFLADADWSNSSNGAWSLVFPNSAMVTSTEQHHSMCMDCSEEGEQNQQEESDTLALDWDELRNCADEAQLLVHNLRVMSLQECETKDFCAIEDSCNTIPSCEWETILFLANNISLCYGAPDHDQNRKKLNDFVKESKRTLNKKQRASVDNANSFATQVVAAKSNSASPASADRAFTAVLVQSLDGLAALEFTDADTVAGVRAGADVAVMEIENKDQIGKGAQSKPPHVDSECMDVSTDVKHAQGNSAETAVDASSNVPGISCSSNSNSNLARRTFAELLRTRRPHLIECIDAHLRDDPEYRLIASNQISTKATHTLLLSRIKEVVRATDEWKRRNSAKEVKYEHLHFMPEQCRPIGKHIWHFMSKLVPSILHRVKSMVLAWETREYLKEIILSKVKGGGKLDQNIRKIDFNVVPTLPRLLEALTPKMSDEEQDSER
jgi:hypothetical protein